MQLLNKLFFLTFCIALVQASVNNLPQTPIQEQRVIQVPNTPHKPTNRITFNQHHVIGNSSTKRRLDFNINNTQPKS